MSAVDFRNATVHTGRLWSASDHAQPPLGLGALRVATLLGLALIAITTLFAEQSLAGVLPPADLDLLVASSTEGVGVAAVLTGLWFASRSGDTRVGVVGTAVAACCLVVRPSPPASSPVGGEWIGIISYAGFLLLGATAIVSIASAETHRRSEQGGAGTARHFREIAAVESTRRGPTAEAREPRHVDVLHRPVFVDLSGRRRIAARWCGRAVAAACIGYVTIACAGISAVHVGPLVPVPSHEPRLPEPDRLRGAPGVLEQGPGSTVLVPRAETASIRSVSVGHRR